MRLYSLIVYLVLLYSIWFAESAAVCNTQTLYSCPVPNSTKTKYVKECLACTEDSRYEDTSNMVCTNHNLFRSYTVNDIVGTFLWFITSGIAASCGAGGGGIYVPLGVLVLKFAAKGATGVSQASRFGASLGGLIINFFKKHPSQNIVTNLSRRGVPSSSAKTVYTRPLIDYTMVLFLSPMEMAGSVAGALIQRVMPNWICVLCGTIILGITAGITWSTFRTKRLAELELAAKKLKEASPNLELTTLNAVSEKMVDQPSFELTSVANANIQTEECNDFESVSQVDDADANAMYEAQIAILERDSRQYPFDKLFALALLWIVLVVLTFLVGGKGLKSLIGLTCKDSTYNILLGVQFAWVLGFGLTFGFKAVRETEQKKAVNYPWQQGDVHWTTSKMLYYCGGVLFSGILTGLFGLGGGMLQGPLLLHLGMDPRVSTATTGTMIILTASSLAIMYVVVGYTPWQYFVYFFTICLLGSYFMKSAIDAYAHRTGKFSTLVASLATIITLATIGCMVTLFVNLKAQDWCLDGITQFCTV